MPSMGMYTEEGVLTAWLRPAGTRVAMGDAVAEITTEKATFEIPAPEEGILHPVATIGTSLRVEALMGYILRNGESAPTSTADGASAAQTSVPLAEASSSPEPDAPSAGPLRASPLAKKLAAQHGINLQQVKGTGPGGRIIEADILARVSKPSGAGQAPAFATDKPASERIPLAGLRRSLADRLRTTLSTAASTTLTREVNADVLVAARPSLSEKLGQALSYDSLFVKLFAAALHERPELNARIENDCIVLFKEINVGFAVAVPNGLIVPVIRNAGSASFREIVGAVKDLTDRALTGHLQPAHLEGGTATISNLGVHGIDAFTPILNGSQAAILGIGRIAERPVVRNAQLAVGQTCVLSLTFDHRVADGAPAALLLDAVARRMNDESFFNSLV
ncbi:MAG TPA: dihydrolipoamide acetyltransferase family protein [Candidatus Bathyarchaeia archaeon]|nr:dihydrolipoamide acetyltransferase family protein [Candidatus Bathyarchaeia archaeon]